MMGWVVLLQTRKIALGSSVKDCIAIAPQLHSSVLIFRSRSHSRSVFPAAPVSIRGPLSFMQSRFPMGLYST